MDYKQQYLKIFNAVSDAIGTLQLLLLTLSAVQLSCESDLTDDDSPIKLESDE